MNETLFGDGLAEKIDLAVSGNATCRRNCSQCETFIFDPSEGFPNLLGKLQEPFESRPACHVYVNDRKMKIKIAQGMKILEAGTN